MNLEEIRQRVAAATEGPWRIGKQSPNGLNNIGTIGGLLTAQTTDEDDENTSHTPVKTYPG
ncbi:hypothetical protein PQS30_16190 [Bacillus licheniformis]|uniref:hypothetical protein n=1 Tax=Bacillus licheniformis TaxID=1402 RepID=UPI003978DF82